MNTCVYKPLSLAYSSLHENGWGTRYDEAKTIRPP
jgi:hypothetical protein